jgi:hypothetical protein
MQFSRLFSIDFDYNYQAHFYMFSLGLFPIIFLLYYTVSIYISGGQTPGSFLLKVKISNNQDENLSLYDSFYWSLSQLLNFFSFGLLFGINMFTKESKGLDQYITGLTLLDMKKVIPQPQAVGVDNVYQMGDFQNNSSDIDSIDSEVDSDSDQDKKAA